MMLQAHKIGAFFYICWGVLHLKAAQLVYQLGGSLDAGMVQGRLFQDAGFLFLFGLASIIVSMKMNWNNSLTGYWINLIGVSCVDILFLFFILMPGYVAPWPGLLGPALWIIAVVFSTLAILRNHESPSGFN